MKMIFAVLIFVIGLIPLFLGYALFFLYEKSKLTWLIFLSMLCITLWQIDISVLYAVKSGISDSVSLFLFKLFRIGPIAALPVILFIAYEVCNGFKPGNNRLIDRMAKRILSKKTLYAAFLSAVLVYGINWSSLGVERLVILENEQLDFHYFYPVYGDWGFAFFIHLALLLFILLLLIIVSNSMEKSIMKSFIKTLVVSSLALFLLGLINLVPGYQLLISSIAVLIFSIVVMLSFIKMYNELNMEYLSVVHRQNKLDSMGNVTASLIHEVNNSLSVIKGYSEIIPSIQKLEPQTAKMMGHVITSSKQLSNLVNAYKRFLRNDFELEFENKDIIRCIQTAEEIMDDKLQESGTVIDIMSEKKAVRGHINETYLIQALVNLIKNAIEAIPPGRVKRVIRFEVCEINQQVVIDMKDCGSGIDQENWEKVFLPYNSNKADGLGLGLPFCNKVMYSHRGSIDIVESNAEGTCFRLQLPKTKFAEVERW
ncbi:sensor histidine kinase [Sediminibacillus massiliensis]|uniref:sensor histidine kinase n=1 Tax=Sediminibacillus massiliensis TaxID=1926277 RepID=UPI0009883013|nr:HAMP domain-containing sensor histidine kinase [Sediminibacillus massiliensis]